MANILTEEEIEDLYRRLYPEAKRNFITTKKYKAFMLLYLRPQVTHRGRNLKFKQSSKKA